MSIKKKFKRFFELDDEYEHPQVEVTYEEPEVPYVRQEKEKKNVVSLTSIQPQTKVILSEPYNFDEVQQIADHLKNRKCVVINLQRLPRDEAKQIVDFMSGTVYALGGGIQKLGHNIFLCTPDNVEVSGSISEIVKDREK